jgi:hypothetical protein
MFGMRTQKRRHTCGCEGVAAETHFVGDINGGLQGDAA